MSPLQLSLQLLDFQWQPFHKSTSLVVLQKCSSHVCQKPAPMNYGVGHGHPHKLRSWNLRMKRDDGAWKFQKLLQTTQADHIIICIYHHLRFHCHVRASEDHLGFPRLRVATTTTIDSPPFRAPQTCTRLRNNAPAHRRVYHEGHGENRPGASLGFREKNPSEVCSYLLETNIPVYPCYPPGKLVVWSREAILIYFLLGARPIFRGYISFREGISPGKGSMAIATPMYWFIMAPQKKIQLLGVSCHLHSLSCTYPP